MKIFIQEKCSDNDMLLIEFEHRKAYLKPFKSAVFGQAVFPLALYSVLYGYIADTFLLGWLSAILLLTFIRAYLAYGWYKADFDRNKTRLIETLTIILSFFNGCLWGVTILFMDFNQYPEASVFLNIIIFGLAAASLGIGSYWLESFLTFNITLFAIYMLGYLLPSTGPYYLLAISILLFLIFIIQIFNATPSLKGGSNSNLTSMTQCADFKPDNIVTGYMGDYTFQNGFKKEKRSGLIKRKVGQLTQGCILPSLESRQIVYNGS